MKRLMTLCFFISICSVSMAQSELLKTNNYFVQINSVKTVISGDINGDNYSDLLVLVEHNESILIYLNNGSKQFYLANNQLSIGGVQAALLQDFDGDGDLDIKVSIVSSEFEDVDLLYTNDGEGKYEQSFLKKYNNQNSFREIELLSGDLNNNGSQDIIRMVYSENGQVLNAEVSINDGLGKFVSYELPIQDFLDLVLADFDNDGSLDIWAFGSGLRVFLNNGEGLFNENIEEISINTINTLGRKTILQDIDNDGDIDVQLIKTSGFVIRYINNGNGIFETTGGVDLNGRNSDNSGVLIDIDGDQILELWISDVNDRNSRIFFTLEDGRIDFTSQVIKIDENRIHTLVADDFDNDGDTDVISIGERGINLWEQNPTSQFELIEQNSINLNWGVAQSVDLADMNNDGLSDLVTTGLNGVKVTIGNGRGGFSDLNKYHDESIRFSHVADLNNDGFSDVTVFNSDRSLKVLINNQENGFDAQTLPIELIYAVPYKILSHDYDLDGDVDLFIQEFSGPIHIFSNEGNNQFNLAQIINGSFRSFDIVDLNQNSEFVLITQNLGSNGGVIQFTFNGDNYVYSRGINIANLYYRYMVFLDQDGDGDLDILTNKLVDQDTYLLVLNDDTTFTPSSLTFTGGRPAHAADFNLDGLVDLVNTAGGVFLNTGSGYEAVNGATADFSFNPFVVGDIDDDMDLDLVLAEVNSGLSTQINTTIDRDFSGLWYNPQQDGHGIQVEHIFSNGEPKVVVSWYVYKNGEQMWLTGTGVIKDDSSTVETFITSGPGFGDEYDADDLNLELWGTMKLTMIDDNRLNFQWDGSSVGDGQGGMIFERFVSIKPVTKKLNTINSCHSGSWYDPNTNGQGFMAQVIEAGGSDRLVMTWYTYFNGKQYWLTGLGAINGNRATLDVQATTGADFPPIFEANDVQRIPWGEIDFELNNNNQAKISWRPILNEFSAGEMTVQRLTLIDRYLCH